MKRKQNKGFTLAELLIVVAIISVLVAISIPIFTSQLEKAREATDAANIRSQYAQVMTDAITEGGDVNGKNQYGAVQLKQQKNEWQNTGLKSNLEGVYGEVVGGYPKAGGTAWVEYKDDQVILHYEDGNGSNGGGSDNGGGGSGDNNGGSGNGTVAEQISSNSVVLPEKINGTFQVERGKIYSYKGGYYVALSTPQYFSQYYSVFPDSNGGNWLYLSLDRENAKVYSSKDLQTNSSGQQVLDGIHRGDLYKTDSGKVYVYKNIENSYYVAPTDGDDNWQEVTGLNLN